MKIDAMARQRFTGYVHVVADANIGRPSVNADGSIMILMATKAINLSGTFNLRVTLTPQEITALGQMAGVGLPGRRKELKSQVAKLRPAAMPRLRRN